MATFVLYNYRFEMLPREGGDVFEQVLKPVNPVESFGRRQEIFGDIFKKDYSCERNLVFESKRNKIFAHRQVVDPKDDVYVLQIQNRKTHTKETENFGKLKDYEFPTCFVIFDNRKEMQRLAIQKRQAAFGGVEAVERYLLNTLNKELKRWGLKVFFDRQIEPKAFWTLAEDRHNYPKGFKRVHFYLPPLNLERQRKVFSNLSFWIRAAFDSGMDWGVNARKGECLRLDKTESKQAQLIEAMTRDVGGGKTVLMVPVDRHQKAVWLGRDNYVEDRIDTEYLTRLAANGEENAELFDVREAALNEIKLFMMRKH